VLYGVGLVGVGLGLVGRANDPAAQVGWVVTFAFYFVVRGGVNNIKNLVPIIYFTIFVVPKKWY
jgi:hypothetical protein